jgi:hypothetical protein
MPAKSLTPTRPELLAASATAFCLLPGTLRATAGGSIKADCTRRGPKRVFR